MATRKLVLTIGNLTFEADLPLESVEGTSVTKARYLIAREREIMRILCLMGEPSAKGGAFLATCSQLVRLNKDGLALVGITPEMTAAWDAGATEFPDETWEMLVSISEDYMAGHTTTIDRLRADMAAGRPPRSLLTADQLQERQTRRQNAKTHHIIPVQELADAARAAKEAAATPSPPG